MLRRMTVIALDGRSLTPADVVAIARRRREAAMAPAARASATRRPSGSCASLLERGELLYGVTTGVGVAALGAVGDRGRRATTSGGCCAATPAAAARR